MASRPFRVRMSEALAEAFEKDLKKAGYGPRKKGVWVGEALHQLERTDPQLKRCGVGDELDSPRTSKSRDYFGKGRFFLAAVFGASISAGLSLGRGCESLGASLGDPQSAPFFLEDLFLLGFIPAIHSTIGCLLM